jgi:hypothetical protein
MKSFASSCLILCFLLWPGAAVGADEVGNGFTFLDTAAGQEVRIAGTFTDAGIRRIKLAEISKPETIVLEKDGAVSEKKDSISFVLPTDFKDGRYRVSIQLGTAPPLQAPGELRVLKPSETQVTVEAVRAVSLYRNPQHNNKYDFEIAGINFSPNLENDIVEIGKVSVEVERGSGRSGNYEKPCLRADPGDETRKLIVEGFDPDGYSRPLLVRVRVGNGNNVSKEMPLNLARISESGVRLWSVVLFALLLLAVFLLVRKGIHSDKVNGESYGPLYAFLMDKKTNSYSLSKFQLVLFTLVAVFGYIYIFLCRVLVQWNFELPPVPEGLPNMLAVSAGTTVVAAGITLTRGTMGAGSVKPSAADFISAGGLVLPERFQFFVWTLVSSFGMLAVLLARDPATLTELPKLPDGMLYLMGLSSAAYLGGKLVRGPGPKITSLDTKKVERLVKNPVTDKDEKHYDLEVRLVGENLSLNGVFQLEDKRIEKTHLIAKTLQGQDADLCTMLNVSLEDVPLTYFDSEHVLRVINGDGQAADTTYGSKIESITVSGARAKASFLVTGRNFKDPSEAKWTTTGGAEVPIPAADVTKASEIELNVKITDQIKGEGTLTIISPGKLTTTSEKVAVS